MQRQYVAPKDYNPATGACSCANNQTNFMTWFRAQEYNRRMNIVLLNHSNSSSGAACVREGDFVSPQRSIRYGANTCAFAANGHMYKSPLVPRPKVRPARVATGNQLCGDQRQPYFE